MTMVTDQRSAPGFGAEPQRRQEPTARRLLIHITGQWSSLFRLQSVCVSCLRTDLKDAVSPSLLLFLCCQVLFDLVLFSFFQRLLTNGRCEI